MHIRTCEENTFVNATPVDDSKTNCGQETCVDNYDISTWGPDGKNAISANVTDFEFDDADDSGNGDGDNHCDDDSGSGDNNCCGHDDEHGGDSDNHCDDESGGDDNHCDDHDENDHDDDNDHNNGDNGDCGCGGGTPDTPGGGDDYAGDDMGYEIIDI